MKLIRYALFLSLLSALTLAADPTPLTETGRTESATAVCPWEEVLDDPALPPLRQPQETRRFYTQRCTTSTAAVWFDGTTGLNTDGADLLTAIRNTPFEGLNPQRYHQDLIVGNLSALQHRPGERNESAAASRRLDVLFTDAYLTLARDLSAGVTDWDRLMAATRLERSKFEWERPEPSDLNLTAYLTERLGRHRIADSLVSLAPDYEEYRRLKGVLHDYRKIKSQGGWPTIPAGPTIRPGDTDARLPLIAQRLRITNDLASTGDANATRYDSADLLKAVQTFQERHGLLADGVIGTRTLEAMNLSVDAKIRSLLINLERFRWLPHGLENSDGYIDVNIPAFRLTVREHGYPFFSMAIIVGKPKRPTPVLTGKLSYAVLNPSWTAPETIVREDILGKGNLIEYLESHDMRVYAVRNGKRVEINPAQIDWRRYAGKKRVPFSFVADSGERNPLGGVKFIFQNPYSVYLHDTNAPSLFQRAERALSSGCVRLSQPQLLLDYLTESNDIVLHSDETVNGESDKILNLKKRIPVVFRYMTTAQEEKGLPSFYRDLYGYDELLFSLIREEVTPAPPLSSH